MVFHAYQLKFKKHHSIKVSINHIHNEYDFLNKSNSMLKVNLELNSIAAVNKIRWTYNHSCEVFMSN